MNIPTVLLINVNFYFTVKMDYNSVRFIVANINHSVRRLNSNERDN